MKTLRGLVYMAVALFTFEWAEFYGRAHLGFTARGLVPVVSLLYSLGLLVVVAVHEFGHAAVALAVGFRFRSLNIGPLTTWKHAGQPRRYLFDWGRLFQTGGYMGAVPDSDVHVRSSAILVILAGPLASLNAALCLWALCLSLRGTAWASWWHLLAILGSLFVGDFVVNLIPMGYSDGTMLWHLALWTEKGRQLYSKHTSAMVTDNADLAHENFDFAHEVELRQRALDQILARGNHATPDLALAYQNLGWAQFHLHDHANAETSLRKSVEAMESARGVEPVLRASTWHKLYLVLKTRLKAADAEQAYSNAASAFEDCKADARTGPGKAEITMLLAQLHLSQRNFALAMIEIAEALATLPSGSKFQVRRANLTMFRAGCEFGLGHVQAGLDALAEAERMLRSHIPDQERKHAMRRMVALGVAFSDAGRCARGAALILEAAGWFEKNGAAAFGALHRLNAATYLRAAGKAEQALAALPPPAAVASWDRGAFLAVRGEIRLTLGRLAEATADFEEAVKLSASRRKAAMRQELLAGAYLLAGRLDEAAGLARRCCDILIPEHNPDAAGALLTLALIDWRQGGENGRTYVEEAVRIVEEDPILQPAAKARALDDLGERLRNAGRNAEAELVREKAKPRWQQLGLDGADAELSGARADLARH